MQRNLTFSIGLAFIALTLGICPARADVVDVSVNGSASVSGTMEVQCFPVGGDCMPGGNFLPPLEMVTYSSNGTFSASGSATAPDAVPVPVTIEGNTDQSITATADDISISDFGGFTAGPTLLNFVTTTETDDALVSFDLTQASLVTFSAGGLGEDDVVSELLDSHGNVIETIPPSPATVVDLSAGMYALQVNASGGTSEVVCCSELDITDFDYVLDASFAEVPEPRRAVFAALVAALLAICILSRRRAA